MQFVVSVVFDDVCQQFEESGIDVYVLQDQGRTVKIHCTKQAMVFESDIRRFDVVLKSETGKVLYGASTPIGVASLTLRTIDKHRIRQSDQRAYWLDVIGLQ